MSLEPFSVTDNHAAYWVVAESETEALSKCPNEHKGKGFFKKQAIEDAELWMVIGYFKGGILHQSEGE